MTMALLRPSTHYFALEFLDAANGVLPGSVEIELKAAGQLNDTVWREHILDAVAPAGTVNVRVRASMTGGVWNQDADPQSYLVDQFSLTAEPVAGVPGDYNQNGTVDAADYTVWRDNLGGTTALPNDDSTGVGADDYTRWKSSFGATGAGTANASAAGVPEPTAGILATLGVIGGAGIRRRARRAG